MYLRFSKKEKKILLSQIFVVQSLSHVQLFVTPGTIALKASVSFTISQSLLKFRSTQSMKQEVINTTEKKRDGPQKFISITLWYIMGLPR